MRDLRKFVKIISLIDLKEIVRLKVLMCNSEVTTGKLKGTYLITCKSIPGDAQNILREQCTIVAKNE